jgi:hypothetical protein
MDQLNVKLDLRVKFDLKDEILWQRRAARSDRCSIGESSN